MPTPNVSFNQALIRALFELRHESQEVKDWLRQCIRLERKRKGT